MGSSDPLEEFSHLEIEEWQKHEGYFPEIGYEYEKYVLEFFSLFLIF